MVNVQPQSKVYSPSSHFGLTILKKERLQLEAERDQMPRGSATRLLAHPMHDIHEGHKTVMNNK